MTRVISARTGINGVSLAPSYVLNKHDDSFFFIVFSWYACKAFSK